MEVLGIVTARGGSKGLINKNILNLDGHPLIAYSIKAALESKLINRCIVSTDSHEIAAIAIEYGAEVPFIRPSHLADDFSKDLDVFQHALNWLNINESYTPDLVCHLRPTSPIRKIGLIDNAILKFSNSNCDSLRVVTPSPITPYKMWVLNSENNQMIPLLNLDGVVEPFNEPRQNLPTIFWQVGTLDVIRPESITQMNSMSGESIMPYVIDNVDSIDIDDIDSFKRAELLILNTGYVRF